MIPSLLLVTALSPSSLQPVNLRCEHLTNPVGIGVSQPRLGWQLRPTKPGEHNLRQSAYQIRVTGDNLPGKPAILWDSGVERSAETVDIPYGGKPLASNVPCIWSVRTWDQAGRPSGWSEAARWSTGLLRPGDWKAQWIGYDAPVSASAKDPFEGASWIWIEPGAPVALLSRRFDLRPGFQRATLRVSADDQFTVRINGSLVAQGDGQGDAWTRPVVLDVAKSLKSGENLIQVRAQNNGGAAGLVAKLVVVYPDGKNVEVNTDDDWQGTATESGDLRPANILESYGGPPWGRIGTHRIFLPAPPRLSHVFSLQKPVRRATLYASALGVIELHLNGRRVSDEMFMPGWTDYAKRVYARAYDVTDRLKRGGNGLAAILGDGWYAGYVGYGGRRELYGSKPRALVQLEVEFTDGSRQTVASSEGWRAWTGPIREADFLMGETFDSRLPWAPVGPVAVGAELSPKIEMFPGQPVRPFAELRAKRVTEPKKGVYVIDLGQNIAGFARLKVNGQPGQRIQLRFAERLSPDATIYTTNLRQARATDTYVCRGGKTEVWEPKFTFHGFQYIEVTGLTRPPTSDQVLGVAVSSDTPTVGQILTSDPLLNKLVSNAWWTQRMNFIDIPTDCPQRDERLGWTGDAQAYVRTAAMLTDVQPFFAKWLVSLDDGQRADGQYPMVAPLKVAGDDGGPAWADAGVICPWTIYDVYGDRKLLARHYPNMRRFVEFCVKRSTPDLLPPKEFHCFGDWLNINSPTPNEVIYTAYFAGSARLLSKSALVLGKTEDAAKYEELFQRVMRTFQRNYVAVDGKVAGDSQCAYVLALGFDLLDESQAKMAADRLVADIEKRGGHLSTGFVGTRDIMHVLSKIGRNDVAFRLLHNTTFPSWGFTIANGATSIWERWDGWTPEKGFQDPGMNSFSHYAFGAVVGWMMAQPAGITNPEPGFRTVRIAPQIDPRLSWLRSSYNSVRGRITSDWSVRNGVVTMRVVVPPNVRAEIVVPATNVRPIPSISSTQVGAGRRFLVGSGEYRFVGQFPGSATIHRRSSQDDSSSVKLR